MGTALMMEGLLSACYHVCPNYTNFQFDTSFMYMIAGLCMLKLYQKRHPDINASAYSAYACLAVVIFFSVIGVVSAGVQQGWAWWNWSTGHPTHQVVSRGAAALPPCRVGQAELGTASIVLCAAVGAWWDRIC